MLLVADLMTPVRSSAGPSDRLAEVVAAMRANGHSCAIVVEGRRARGILTERDLVRVLDGALSEGDLRNLPVYAVMSPDPICVRFDNTLSEALSLARQHRLRHLPVIDGEDNLVGVITQTDMIDAYVELLEQQARLMRDNEHLQLQSREDPLLGIGNRRALEVDLERIAATAARHNQPYALALLDVDWFKRYNDRCGHLAGDQALRDLVAAIDDSMREGDSLYRFGGEELLLLMPNTDLEGARLAVERARQAVEARAIHHPESERGILTLSAGVASAPGVDKDYLVAAADRAMYRAKSSGRNCVQLACDQDFSDSDGGSRRYIA